ncbi:MAG TPA: cytochrome c biogenesis protein CcsA [Anaeromyxobacteraceae bacterium]|nr:cytochrome c biogenesis protein CcsA [Anaeromyxobacteraceae bacterium]
MASAVLTTAAAVLYLVSAAGYGAAFVRPALTRIARVAFVLAAAGFTVQGVAIGLGCRETGGQHLLTVRGAAGLVGWMAAGVFVLVQRRFGKPAAGAFALPLVVAAVLPGVFAPEASGSAVAAALATVPAVKVHVTTAAAGIALFALASASALMYLLQHRELKQKRFGALLPRLPSLGALDRMMGHLVAAGFAVFTVALLSGSVLARSAWCSDWARDGQQLASLVTWLAFGAMVLARRAGSHGRRQAVLTLVAFAFVITSLVGVRQAGTTRHARFDAQPAIACAGPI